jgi:tRNA(fMet)-specific endonuclease VapC
MGLILSLDANVLIDLANRRRARVRQAFDDAVAAGDSILASSFAAHELIFGAMISARPTQELAVAERLLQELSVAAFTLEDARSTAELRRRLKMAGRPIGPVDTLIAGQALGRGWTVVTANLREFGRVEGLQVIDWTAPPEGP